TSSIPLFCFNGPANPVLYTLSLHDALPISAEGGGIPGREPEEAAGGRALAVGVAVPVPVAGGAAPPEEILASTFCTAFCRSTSCWLSLPWRDLISSRLSERP